VYSSGHMHRCTDCRFQAVLSSGRAPGESALQFLETNDFKQLPHLTLAFRPGYCLVVEVASSWPTMQVPTATWPVACMSVQCVGVMPMKGGLVPCHERRLLYRTDAAVKQFLAFRLGEVSANHAGLASELRAVKVHIGVMMHSIVLVE
jgi:hypothetical protein